MERTKEDSRDTTVLIILLRSRDVALEMQQSPNALLPFTAVEV